MKTIFILSQQRSGSTSLIQRLSKELNTEFTIFEEVFLDQPTDLTNRIYPDLDLLPRKRFYEQNKSVKDYLKDIANKKKIIIKLMLDQITPEIKEFIKHNNVEIIFFNRKNIDCAKSSAKIKLGINRAHKQDKNGFIVKNPDNDDKKGLIFKLTTFLYFLKNLYYKSRYKNLINSSTIFHYPDFNSVIKHIKN